MVPAHKMTAVLSEDGKLMLEGLPFRAGQAVELIVMYAPLAQRPTPYPPDILRGSVLRYDDPFAQSIDILNEEVPR